MDAPLDIRKSDDFETSWAVASYELGHRAEEFDKKLLAAVDKLWQERPGFGVPSESSVHTVPVMGRYELVYEWATDFSMKGAAVAHHLVLLLIRRK
jgi:hypothetical protein